MNSKQLFSVVAALFTMLMLAGCAPPEARTLSFVEDSYTSDFSVRGKWAVRVDGKVTVEVDEAGTVNIYSSVHRENGRDYWPNIKVSGPAKFAVHSGNRVTATDGATVAAYECSVVRARAGTTVDAYNCDLVEAYGAVKSVQPHGRTRVEKYPEPDSLATPETPTSKPTPQVPPTGSPSAEPAR